MVNVCIPKNFKKVLGKKEKALQAAVKECMRRLVENPRHPGLNTHKMKGIEGVWEAYVDAGNRITFHYGNDGTIIFRNNCDHDMLLRNP